MRFNGPSYDHGTDSERLTKQHASIRELMLDGVWRTLREIEAATGYASASVSAQLRHLRKPRFGSYIVEKRHRGAPALGHYEYRVLRPEGKK